MRAFGLFLFLIPFSVINLIAQDKIPLHGQIVDIDGMPISNVSVAVQYSTIGTLTDQKGKYILHLSKEKHTIIISAIDYETITVDIDTRARNIYNCTMHKKAIDLSAVEIKGKSNVQKLREGGYSANAIDVKSASSAVHSLSTMVGRSSGIRIREKGGTGSDFDLSINGLSGNSIRYFIDGVPLATMGKGTNLSNIPINIVDRVEIFKGVVPTYLGADALGGAINIITRNDKKNYLDFSLGAGSFHTAKADFNAQYVDTKTGLFFRPVFGINFSKNDYKMKGMQVAEGQGGEFLLKDVKRFHDDYISLLGQVEIGFTKKPWADVLSITASMSSVDKEIQTGRIESIVYGMAKRKNESFNLSALYKKTNLFTNGLSADLYISHTWDHTIVTDTAFRKYRWDGTYFYSPRNEIRGRDRSIRHYKRPLSCIRTNFDYQINDSHSINLNYLLSHYDNKQKDDIDTEFIPSNDILEQHIIGLSYNQSLLKDRLTNAFFAKQYINHLEVNQQELYWITNSKDVPLSSTNSYWGYGIASRFKIFDALSVKASYERSIRLPLGSEYLGNGGEIYPNYGLKPERSNNYNFGIFGTINLASKHQLYYESGFFTRKIEDYIRLSQEKYINLQNVTTSGIEGEIRYEYNNLLQIIANITYLKETNKTRYQQNGKPDISYNNRVPNKPWLYSNIEVNMKKQNIFNKKNTQFKIAYNFQYIHWYYYTWVGSNTGSIDSKEMIPTQCVSDIVATYSIKKEKYNLSLECTNIFDRTTYDNFRLQKPGRAFFCKFRVFIN